MKIVVLISGYGSNLEAIIKHIKLKNLPINILAVLSDNAEAMGLKIAQSHTIATIVVPYEKTTTREIYGQTLLEQIKPLKPDWIILAGFMRVLSNAFVNNYKNKILNIHPSLLPKYPGLDTHQKALNNKDQEHGCTVHLVSEVLDSGPIIVQRKFNITTDDTILDLKTKVQKLEHEVYPEVIESLLKN